MGSFGNSALRSIGATLEADKGNVVKEKGILR
jgi:hypothetical protein